MANHFHENRKRIQEALYESDFVEVLQDSEYVILEEKNAKGAGLLRELKILSIPHETETSHYNAWAIDLESNKSVFSAPSFRGFKTVERAIIFYTTCSMYVLMVEMKNSLQPFGESGIESIEQKFRATISRLSVLLPIHIYGSDFEDVDIKYIGIIAYNEDKVTSELGRDEVLARKNICKTLVGSNKCLSIEDDFKYLHQVDIHFCQNPDTTTSLEYFEIDLANLFIDDDWNFPNASFSELKCPKS